jgi:hypothetical protein
MGKPLACRFGWHKWVRRSTSDGAPFRQCARCGTDAGESKAAPGAGFG